MLTEEQKSRIRRFHLDLVASLSEDQRKLIKNFWDDVRPSLSPMQKMVVDAVLGAVGS